jgi:hypothetical protein
MTLPVTYTEAVEGEALRFARDKIAEFKKSNPFSEHSALSGDASRMFFRHMLQIGLGNAVNRMQIVAAAKAGDPDAVDLLRSVLIEAKSRRTELSTELQEYDMWLTTHGAHPRRRSEKRGYVMRDICIALTVAGIVDKFPELPPTGRSPRHRSACAIVGEALIEADAAKGGSKVVHMRRAYETIKTVWGRYKHVMPTVPGWASTW